MSMKGWYERQKKKINTDDATWFPRLFRRSFFHNYYEGYTEIREPCNNLRGYKIKRVYSAAYYRADLSSKKNVLVRVLYCLLLVLAVALLCYAAWIPAACNYVWYATFPQAVSFVFLGLSLLAVCNYIFTGRDLKIREYRQGSRNVIRWSFGATVALVCAAAGSALYGFLHIAETDKRVLICVLCNLAASAAMLTIHKMEVSIEYTIVSNSVDFGTQATFPIEKL